MSNTWSMSNISYISIYISNLIYLECDLRMAFYHIDVFYFILVKAHIVFKISWLRLMRNSRGITTPSTFNVLQENNCIRKLIILWMRLILLESLTPTNIYMQHVVWPKITSWLFFTLHQFLYSLRWHFHIHYIIAMELNSQPRHF